MNSAPPNTKLDTQIANIFNNFDWKEVLRIMRDARLPWFDENGCAIKNPTETHLKEVCLKLLRRAFITNAIEEHGYFRAQKKGNFLELEFILESATSRPLSLKN